MPSQTGEQALPTAGLAPVFDPAAFGRRRVEPFILAGQECFGSSETIRSIYYPGDHASLVGECHQASLAHLSRIEEAAEKSFQITKYLPVARRQAILRQLSALLAARHDELVRLITLESGKPVKLSRLEVARAIRLCAQYAERLDYWADSLYAVDDRQALVRRFPLGPVLAITPYNFPLNLVMHKLAPAIATGCAITIKPAPQTPLTALLLGNLAIEAGYEGISVIPSETPPDSPSLAETLVQSPAFAKLSFTGSARVGWHLKTLAGRKSVTLELGGNAALVIEDFENPAMHADMTQAEMTHGDDKEKAFDHALQEAACQAAFGAFAYAGQTCISVQRIFVNRTLYDAFVPALVQATRRLKVGDPFDPATDLGPMITLEDVRRTRSLIKDALNAGANVVYGGNTFNSLTMNPTLLDRTTPEMTVNAEEVFAPIATLTPYDTFSDALRQVNMSRFGLQAGVYSGRSEIAQKAFDALEVGGLIMNDIPGYRSDRLPYGGVKESGLGREGVLSGLEDYTYPKTLVQKNRTNL